MGFDPWPSIAHIIKHSRGPFTHRRCRTRLSTDEKSCCQATVILTSEYLGPNPSPSRPPQRSFHHDPQGQSQSLISRKTFQAWHLHPLNWWSYDNWQVGRRTEFKPQLCTPEVISTTVWTALEPVSIGIRAELRKSKRLLSRCEAGLGFGSVHLWRIVGFTHPKTSLATSTKMLQAYKKFNKFNKKYTYYSSSQKKETILIITLWWTNMTMENHHFQWENPL